MVGRVLSDGEADSSLSSSRACNTLTHHATSIMSSDESSITDELDYPHHPHYQQQQQFLDSSTNAVADAAAAAGIDDMLVGIDTDEYMEDPIPPVFEDTKLKPRHPCSVCRQCFALRSTWYDHMRQAHNITKPFSCDECPKRYSMLGALNYHRLTTHRGVVHACKTCGKRFMTKPGLVRHAKSHFGGVYLCEDCSKTFPTRDSLRRHRQQVHMGEKPHVCQYCQERFGASHSLKRHIKRRHSAGRTTHTTGTAASGGAGVSGAAEARSPSHTCTVCHKAFFSSEALRKHVQSMHQHARYQCETCLRRFSDWSNLNRHRKATKGCMPVLRVDSCDTSTSAGGSSCVTSSTGVGANGGMGAECYSVVSSSDHYGTVDPQSEQQQLTAPIVIQHLTLQPTTQLQLQLATADGEQLVLPASAVTALTAAEEISCVPTAGELQLNSVDSAEFPAGASSTGGSAGCLSVDCGTVSPSQSSPAAGDVCTSVDAEVELAAEFTQHYTTASQAAGVISGLEAECGGGGVVAVSAGDHVELQPVNAMELQTLEAAAVCTASEDGSEHTLLVPVTLTTAAGGSAAGQDVYVTLYPASGDGSGHRFICVQNGDGAVLTELPVISEQILDVN